MSHKQELSADQKHENKLNAKLSTELKRARIMYGTEHVKASNLETEVYELKKQNELLKQEVLTLKSYLGLSNEQIKILVDEAQNKIDARKMITSLETTLYSSLGVPSHLL